MIKYESIISSFDDKDTLYNWLRKVEEQLKNASATGFVVNKKGNATLSFSITFADGETLESGDIVLQQGESVDNARISNGILQLHLTNGSWLNAGNVGAVSSFEIDASQHVIVHYQDGTSADLGALGDFSNADFTAKTLEQTNANFLGDNINFSAPSGLEITNTYNRLEIVNQILYVIINFKILNNSGVQKTFSGVDLMAELPHKYAQKVIDVLGNSVGDVASEAYVFITGDNALATKNTSSYNGEKLSGKIFLCNRNIVDKLSVFANLDNTLTMETGDYLYFTGRIALTLI